MRLTEDTRRSIHNKVMQGLPVIDYRRLIQEAVQDAIVDFMPPEVRVVWDNPELRGRLKVSQIDARSGNNTVWMDWQTYGVTGHDHKEIAFRREYADNPRRAPEGSLLHHILINKGVAKLIDKHFEQKDLHKSVAQRLRANLKAATTIKRLYDVLEPDLHHFIPKEHDKIANLPATVAPVADDLRKLGAVLPNVPKAKEASHA